MADDTNASDAIASHRGVMPDEAEPRNWAPTWPEKPRFSDGLDIPGTYLDNFNPNVLPKCSGPITLLTREEADRLLGKVVEDFVSSRLL